MRQPAALRGAAMQAAFDKGKEKGMKQSEKEDLLRGCPEAQLERVRLLLCGQGFCTAHASVVIAGRRLCFTGRSARARREDIAHTVTALGGTFQRRVTRGTDYLVVGEQGSPSWAHGTFGDKIRCASHLKSAAKRPQIVSEADFWAACEREEKGTTDILSDAERRGVV